MVLRERAELDVDPSGFQKGVRKAGQSFERLEKDVSKVGGQISTVMQFAGGFGIISAISQASAAFEGFIQNIKAQSEAVIRRGGISPIGTAADLTRRAGEAKAAAVGAPFRAAGAGVQAAFLQLGRFGLDIATLGGLLGGEDIKRGIDDMIAASRETAEKFAVGSEALRSVAKEAEIIAKNARNFEQRQRQVVIPELVRQAQAIRIDSTTLNEIIRGIKQIGVEETIARLTKEIQAAAQNAQVTP